MRQQYEFPLGINIVQFSIFIFVIFSTGFYLSHKREHSDWSSIKLGPTNRTYIANGLKCGTKYFFVIKAFNSNGDSPDSTVIQATTNGSSKRRLLYFKVDFSTKKKVCFFSFVCMFFFCSILYHMRGEYHFQSVYVCVCVCISVCVFVCF